MAPDLIPRRNLEQSQIYHHHVEEHRKQGRTPEQAILLDIFQNSKKDASKLVITTFPYWLEDNIVHLLVFINRPNWDQQTLRQTTESLLKHELPDVFDTEYYDFVIHINQPRARSVPGLAHSHIFLRSKKQDGSIYPLVSGLPFSNPNTPPSGWPSHKVLIKEGPPGGRPSAIN